jgi:hypothetical protein
MSEKAHRLDYATASGGRCGGRPIGGMACAEWSDSPDFFASSAGHHDDKLYETPLILVGTMWAELVEWARKSMLRPDGSLASPEDLGIPICCPSGPEVLDVLRKHHSRWKENQEAAS